ncbi:ADP-ribosylglycohydrolase family protein [Nocardia vinacea]|uniref:ADP-ribosylglycohydrolase family protein n=1 Tax=Nocardia vinacea TaxID=96468 RepID=UPI0009FBD2D7
MLRRGGFPGLHPVSTAHRPRDVQFDERGSGERVPEQHQPGTPLDTRPAPSNDSKDCAAVVRAALCGLDRRRTIGQIFEFGCDAAVLTHGNPSGWLPARHQGRDHRGSVPGCRSRCRTRSGPRRTHPARQTRRDLDRTRRRHRPGCTRGRPDARAGGYGGLGWIGPEASAIGVFAALAAEKVGGTPEQMFRNGILFAVNHSGDSDSTGAILGTRYGRRAIPPEWRAPCSTPVRSSNAWPRTLYRIRPHSAERRLRCADGGVGFRDGPTSPRWRPVVGCGRRGYPATARRAHRPRPN